MVRIAWGITGAGHYLRQSIEIIQEMINQGYELDVFLSSAGETVLKMYQYDSIIEELHAKSPQLLKHIFHEKEQAPGFPICARFNLNHYDYLIISPLTANSVGKMTVGIADTLITNIFAQMIKGGGKIIVIPCDIIAGEINTEAPNGKIVKIHVDQFNSENAKKLQRFPNVSVLEQPKEVWKVIK